MVSAWIEHVKEYARTHNIKYGEALKLAKESYHSNKLGYPKYDEVQQGGKLNAHNLARKTKNTFDKVKKKATHYAEEAKDEGNKMLKTAKKTRKIVKRTLNDEVLNNLVNVIDDVAGNDNLKKGLSGAKKSFNKVNNTVKEFEDAFHPSHNPQVETNEFTDTVNDDTTVEGGRIKAKNVIRKTKNTLKQTKNIARAIAPVLSMVAPEVGLPLEAAIMATGGSFKQMKAKVNAIKMQQQGSGCGCQGSGLKQMKNSVGGSYLMPSGGAFPIGGVNDGRKYTNQYQLLSTTHPSINPVKPRLID